MIDHLGLLQPARPPVPADVWADLPKLLDLARYPNVRVKVSGACTMSHRPFPYDDIWEPVLRVIDAFGLDRCMWGTDWTRAIGMLTYEQARRAVPETKRLSASDKAALMGGTVQKRLQVVTRRRRRRPEREGRGAERPHLHDKPLIVETRSLRCGRCGSLRSRRTGMLM